MRKKQLELVKVINSYFGCDAAYFDVDAFTLAKRIMEAGWEKPVRCKDCNSCCHIIGKCDRTIFGCSYMGRDVKPDDFCSYGERREGE